MEFLLKWAVMASVQLAATMSPGPAFVISVKNAMAYDRSVGVFTALGLALGVGVHVLFVLAGIALLIAQSVWLFQLLKYVGAAYLIYIGIKAFKTSSPKMVEEPSCSDEHFEKGISVPQAITQGFLTNLLNPKAMIFFTAVYTQFIDITTPFFMHVAYGLTSVVIEFIWFAGVAFVLTNPHIKQKFTKAMSWIERVCGGLMIGLGLKLAFMK